LQVCCSWHPCFSEGARGHRVVIYRLSPRGEESRNCRDAFRAPSGLGHIYAGEPVKGLFSQASSVPPSALPLPLISGTPRFDQTGRLAVSHRNRRGVCLRAHRCPFCRAKGKRTQLRDHPLSVAIGPGVALRGGSEVFSGISAAVRFSL